MKGVTTNKATGTTPRKRVMNYLLAVLAALAVVLVVMAIASVVS